MTTKRSADAPQEDLALVRSEPAPLAPAEPSVGSMLQLALQSGVTPDGLEKLVNLYERVEAKRAEREYAVALAEFQRRCPKIPKNRSVLNKDGRTVRYKYATLDSIMDIMRPHLEACGFSVSWDSRIENGMVTATAIVRHVGGHTTETTFAAPVEREAFMNDAQKSGSATSFAMRYAVRLAFGITPEGEDDDAGALNGKTITEQQAAEIEGLIAEIGADRPAFLRFMGVDSLSKLPQRDYRRAVSALERKRDQR